MMGGSAYRVRWYGREIRNSFDELPISRVEPRIQMPCEPRVGSIVKGYFSFQRHCERLGMVQFSYVFVNQLRSAINRVFEQFRFPGLVESTDFPCHVPQFVSDEPWRDPQGIPFHELDRSRFAYLVAECPISQHRAINDNHRRPYRFASSISSTVRNLGISLRSSSRRSSAFRVRSIARAKALSSPVVFSRNAASTAIASWLRLRRLRFACSFNCWCKSSGRLRIVKFAMQAKCMHYACMSRARKGLEATKYSNRTRATNKTSADETPTV